MYEEISEEKFMPPNKNQPEKIANAGLFPCLQPLPAPAAYRLYYALSEPDLHVQVHFVNFAVSPRRAVCALPANSCDTTPINTMNTAPTTRKGMHYGFIIVVCCCLMMGINIGLAFSCAGIFYKPVSSAIGVSVGEFGLYMSFMYVASTLMLSIGGKMIEKYSARLLLSGSSALMGLTFIGMALSDSLWQFYAAGCVLGITVAFLLYLSFPTLINRWFRTKVGFLMGVCSAASGIGGMIFNPIGAAMITNWGWRWAYAAFGLLIILLVTPLLLLLLRDRPQDKGLRPYGEEEAPAGKSARPSEEGVPYSRAIRMPVFYALMLFAFLMMACSTLNLFIPNFVTGLDFSLEQASFAAAAVMTGVCIGKLVLGHINDRNCLCGVLVTTLAGAGGLLMLIGGVAGIWIIIAGAFLFGWAYAGVTVQTAMLTRTVFGNLNYARINAIISMALAAGGALASGGWGLIVDGTSYRFIFTIGIVMLLVCTAIGVAALRRRYPTAAKG